MTDQKELDRQRGINSPSIAPDYLWDPAGPEAKPHTDGYDNYGEGVMKGSADVAGAAG